MAFWIHVNTIHNRARSHTMWCRKQTSQYRLQGFFLFSHSNFVLETITNALLLSSVWWNTYFCKCWKGRTCKNQKSRVYFSWHWSSCQNVRILCLVPLRADSLKNDKQISFYFIANNISLFSPILFLHVSFLQHYVDFCSASLLSQFPYLSM